jgi:hypothetical protein
MRVICLANSWRPGGRCIAGVDVETHTWVRPVPAGGGAVPLNVARQIDILDIVDISLEQPRCTTRFQRENMVAPDWNWRVVDRATTKDIAVFLDDTSPILHGVGDYMWPAELRLLPRSEWKSLQLVRPRQLKFVLDSRKPGKWRAQFLDTRGKEYNLKVTDPRFDALPAGNLPGGECFITVSLGEPWAPEDCSEPPMCYPKCYRLAAAIIEL